MRTRLSDKGLERQALLSALEDARRDDANWRRGELPLYVYFAGEDVLQVAKDAYGMFMQEAGHAASAFPSIAHFESEVIDMVLGLMKAGPEATGDMTLGGTESVFLAVKTARDRARGQRGASARPFEIVAPYSAHPCINKAADYLGLNVRRVPLGSNHRADVTAMAHAITDDTIMLYGSAPCWPHGVYDPIRELGTLAQERRLWFHVDACLGGMIAPFATRLGRPIPDFDFSVPGVTSLSVDLHKFGFAPKGTSCVLLHDACLRKYQLFEFTDWPRGLYASTGFAGTRPGGPIAAAWAVMNYLGEEGYKSLAEVILRITGHLVEGVGAISDIGVCNEVDLNIVTIGSDSLDIANVAAGMHGLRWHTHLGGDPPTMHFMVNPVHEPFIDAYLRDLEEVVCAVRSGQTYEGGAAVYGA